MPENEQPKNENENQYQDYIETIETLKKTSVPKEDYEKLLEEKRSLVKALVDGGQMQDPNPEDKKTSDELAKELCTANLSNLGYVKAALAHREKCIEEGKPDPFMPKGALVQEGKNDRDDAQAVADLLQECVEGCNGSSVVFTSLLQSKMQDLPIKRK